MRKLLKVLICLFISVFLFLIFDAVFFYSIVFKEYGVFKSQQKYEKGKFKDILPRYFIKLKKFEELYKDISKYDIFRPIQNSESKERPILIFGCSYAYGYVFDNTETISYVMSKYSTRPIINRAVSGWGIQHVLYQLREDKEFTSSIKNPKYVFYVLMDNGGHFERLFYTNFPNIIHKDYYFTYKLENDKLVERKPFLNQYYGFALTRHIYNKIVSKNVQKAIKRNDPKFYDLLILYFLSIDKQIKDLYLEKENKIEDAPKFVILTFEGNNEQYWKPQLEEKGIKVINIAEIIDKEKLITPEYGFFEPEVAPHPNGNLWKALIPKLKNYIQIYNNFIKELNMTKVLAIDVGGTKLVHAIINEKGEFLSEVKRTSTPKNIDELKKIFEEIILNYENNIDMTAFATAGAVNISNTKVDSSTPNLPEGYNNIDFSKLSKKPVYVENDANAAAWAEYKVGSAIGEDNNITITLGTGVGGGFIINGKLLRGKSGRGGEVGSMKINGKNRICTCQRKNCWESYASGTGLKMKAYEVASNDDIFKTSIFKSKKLDEITTYDIIEGLKKDDEYSKLVFNIWKQDLITGLINITNIFDPESIIISGGMGEFINTQEVENAVNSEIVVSPIKVKLAKAGNYAGMIGAALLACEKYDI